MIEILDTKSTSSLILMICITIETLDVFDGRLVFNYCNVLWYSYNERLVNTLLGSYPKAI